VPSANAFQIVTVTKHAPLQTSGTGFQRLFKCTEENKLLLYTM